MRVAILARFSSKMQDVLSLDAQVHETEAFAAKQGWTVTHRFLMPETSSYELADDETFQEMLAAGKRKEFDVLLVHKLDRLGRDLETTIQAKALLRRHGIQVRSVVENLGDTIQDKLIENVLAVIGDYYSLNLGQETKKGHRQLTRAGFWKGGTVPYGYRAYKEPTGTKSHTRLEPDPVTGPVMAEVFRRIAAGHRTGDVLDWVATTTEQPRWSLPSLYTRVRNPLYHGALQYGRTSLHRGQRTRQSGENLVEGKIEGLVTEDVWKRANGQITARGTNHGQKRRPKRAYLLSEGVATCASCGRPLIGNVSGGVPRYTCSGRRDSQCPARVGVNAEELESAIYHVFAEEIKNFDVAGFLEDYQASLAPELEEARRREGRLRKALSQTRGKLKNLAKALADGCDFVSVRELMSGLQQEERTFVDEIAVCQLSAEKDVKANVALVHSYLSSFADLVPEMTPEELKEFYQRNLAVEWDLQKQEGQLYLKLTPAERRPVSLHGYPLVGVRRSSLVR